MATPPDFTNGAVLTAAQMDKVAMWTVGGGTYTGADPIAVTGCFTSDFRNYRIVAHLYGSAATQNLALNFYTGTNTIFNTAVYNRWGFSFAGGAIGSASAAGQTSYVVGTTNNVSTELSALTIDVFGPNEAMRTKCVSQGLTSGGVVTTYHLDLASTTAFTGFQLDAATGTLTGNVWVYGYNNL